jgi:hypothetical protein
LPTKEGLIQAGSGCSHGSALYRFAKLTAPFTEPEKS